MTNHQHLRITTWPGSPVPVPRAWVEPDVRVVDGERLLIGSGHGPGQLVAPPDQLYLFELADLDLASVESVAEFTRKHGTLADAISVEQDRDLPKAESMPRSMLEVSTGYGRSYAREHRLWPDLSVHVDEFTYRAHVLRRLTSHVLAYGRGEDVRAAWPESATTELQAWDNFRWFTNAALAPFHVRVEIDLGDTARDRVQIPSLYSIAVLQLVNDLSEHPHWLSCPACGRDFLRQRGRSAHYSRRSGVTYCSKECANAQAQRAWRSRQRLEKESNA